MASSLKVMRGVTARGGAASNALAANLRTTVPAASAVPTSRAFSSASKLCSCGNCAVCGRNSLLSKSFSNQLSLRSNGGNSNTSSNPSSSSSLSFSNSNSNGISINSSVTTRRHFSTDKDSMLNRVLQRTNTYDKHTDKAGADDTGLQQKYKVDWSVEDEPEEKESEADKEKKKAEGWKTEDGTQRTADEQYAADDEKMNSKGK
jgi:hypothetical protein